ncbi:MAG: phosphotransferase [Thermoanaerobaculaceae bacterium]|nr:phosphotransferase [Thermoanaerobaculaceae bacterium]
MEIVHATLTAVGVTAVSLTPLAGDASQRRFFRAVLADGTTLVAALYPAGHEGQAERDHAVQAWGWERGLPIPRPVGREGLVVVSEDVGDLDLERAMATTGENALVLALEALAGFQACEWRSLVTPPFDAAFFRRELAVFERYALAPEAARRPDAAAFLDDLAARLASHPYRLTHRDFHCNNLFLHEGRVRAVDYQDMRGGPDTYDLASLLGERGGARLAADEAGWVARAAGRLEWEPGWPQRYLECAAQRRLKVIGTFLRLGAAGRPAYLAWLPAVRERAAGALAALGTAPDLVRALVSAPHGGL